MTEVMLDLETLGTGNNAIILSIGAVKFNDDEITDRFHAAIDPVSCQALGLKIDASTVLWWLDPERADARATLLDFDRIDLASALDGFARWVGEPCNMYGNGSTFDNVILRNAYAAAGLEYPVKFWQDLCYRTLKTETPFISYERVGTHHNAVDDAETQAVHLQSIRKHHRSITEPAALLAKAAKQFRFYETNHRAKDTHEANAKAEVNRMLAEEIEGVLAAIA